MSDESQKKSIIDEEFVPIYQKRLGEAITFAKGNMSMAEFAKKCEMNPITFSRIVKGDIKKPLSQEEIKTIAENSEQDTEYIFKFLMRENGMVPKNDDNADRQERDQIRAENKQRRETIQNSLIRSLFESGCTISPVANTEEDVKYPLKNSGRYKLVVRVSFVLSVQGDEAAFWNFNINSFSIDEYRRYTKDDTEDETKAYNSAVRREVSDVVWVSHEIFLRDVWEPEAFENTRYSFVFDNKDVFEGFFKYLEGVKANNSFSLILVDIKEQRVVEERFIPRHDGKEQKSLFIPIKNHLL